MPTKPAFMRAPSAPRGRYAACDHRVMEIRDARPEERDALRELHRRASLIWDADRPHLEAHPELFGVAAEAIAEGRTRVAVDADGSLLGFSGIARLEPGVCELDDLFVSPDVMRQGIGAALVEDVAARATAAGDRELAVIASPDAIGFYERVGFARGESVPTRFRPGVRMRRALTA
jgi:N-acetylglutamate synthase-like GNAT family acetyltransferase